MSQVLNQIRFSMPLLKDELSTSRIIWSTHQFRNKIPWMPNPAGAQTNLCSSDISFPLGFSLGEVTVTAAVKMFMFTFSLQ